MRSEAVAALMLCACSTSLEIGIEKRIAITSAVVDASTGEVLEAGHQLGDLWYGRARTDGTLVREQRLDVSNGNDALFAAVALPTGGWAVAGEATGSDGKKTAWVRALDASDAEVWTRTLTAPAGREWSARALAVTPEGGLVVGGLESGGATDDGWIVRLGTDGTVGWQRSFATDFQSQASLFRLYGMAVLGQSYMRVFPSGRRTKMGETYPGALEMTLDGQLYNSSQIDTGEGTAKCVFVDEVSTNLVFCVEVGGTVAVREFDRSFMGLVREQVLSVDGATLELGGCARASDGDILIGATAVYGDGRRIPHGAKVEKDAREIRFDRPLDVEHPTSALGVAADASGSGWLVGFSEQPQRRWAARIP